MVVAPLDVRGVLDLFREPGFEALGHAAEMPFEAHLDLATAAAWLGAVDHARSRVWEGTARPDDPAPAGDIAAFIRQWWGTTGLENAMTALPVLSDTPTPPSEDALRTGLRTLADRGLFGSTPRGLVPQDVTRRLVYDGRLPIVGMQWQQTIRGDEGLIVGHRIVLVRVGGLALCLDRSVPGHVLLRTITLPTLADELADRLTVPEASLVPEPRSGEPTPPASGGFCTTCGAPRKAGATFCTSCGTAFAPDAPGFCRQCGAGLPEGVAFCTSCGHPAT